MVWKLQKHVLWQVSSKLPMAFDVAFQTDFINLALVILGERWQKIPESYFWFEVLILNRTVPFFCLQIQHAKRFPAGYLERDDLWCMWEVQPQTEWERPPAPASSFTLKCRIVGIVDLAGACLIHPCCPRIDPLSILSLREAYLRDLSGCQCSKYCDIYCQSSTVSSTLESFS